MVGCKRRGDEEGVGGGEEEEKEMEEEGMKKGKEGRGGEGSKDA